MNIDKDQKKLHTAIKKLLKKYETPILKQMGFVFLTGSGIYATAIDVFCDLSVHPTEIKYNTKPGEKNTLAELIRVRTIDALFDMRDQCAEDIKLLGGTVDE